MITKLNIINGIIQDKEIDGIPVKLAIIEPIGKPNVRTLIKMIETIGITNHNTANSSHTAGDESHARYFNNLERIDDKYIGAHLFVDDDSITQVLPINEVSYNAGDGKGAGNYKTISIEICENRNYEKAELNAKKLNVALIMTYPSLKVYKHQDWSGKYCPHKILERPNGWQLFVKDIYDMLAQAKTDVSDWARPSWDKAVKLGIEDGIGPKNVVTSEQLMVYFDRLGLLK